MTAAAKPNDDSRMALPDYAWLRERLLPYRVEPVDVMATLAELTARSAVEALAGQPQAVDELLVCGGGAYNGHLMRRLAALAHCPVRSTAEAGVPPDQVESLAFAWLASAFVARQPGNLPAVTGARGPRVLGALYPAR